MEDKWIMMRERLLYQDNLNTYSS